MQLLGQNETEIKNLLIFSLFFFPYNIEKRCFLAKKIL